jgi:hypothetical protein
MDPLLTRKKRTKRIDLKGNGEVFRKLHILSINETKKKPNKWLQATWPRLKVRTPKCDCRIPAKIVIE